MKIYTGKNIDDLLQAVATEKGVAVSELEYEIIEEKGGFLGIGSKVVAKITCEKDIEEFILSYLSNFFQNIKMNVKVTLTKEERVYKIILDSENNALLIGKNGLRLQSITNVVRSAASAKFKRRLNVIVDVNGYKEDKYHKICSQAVRIAKTVQKTKVDAVLDPMPNDERKAIHHYLTNMPRVRTLSEGEGNQRRIKLVYDETKK